MHTSGPGKSCGTHGKAEPTVVQSKQSSLSVSATAWERARSCRFFNERNKDMFSVDSCAEETYRAMRNDIVPPATA